MNNYYHFNANNVNKIPIREINFSEKVDVDIHTRISSLVDQMLIAHKECQTASTDSDKNICQQRIDLLDKQIDALVYELYGLTDEEIKLIEGEGI